MQQRVMHPRFTLCPPAPAPPPALHPPSTRTLAPLFWRMSLMVAPALPRTLPTISGKISMLASTLGLTSILCSGSNSVRIPRMDATAAEIYAQMATTNAGPSAFSFP